MATLLLRLAGPTHCWRAYTTRYGVKATGRLSAEHLIPTRSAVFGLLAGAQGRTRGADMSDLHALDMGVRTDQRGRPRAEFKTSRRRKAGQWETVVKRETVLDDAAFLVGVSGDRGLLDDLEAALAAPVWAPSLGQRAYPVTLPLELGVVDEGLETALRQRPWLAADWYRRRQPQTVSLPLVRSRWAGPAAGDDTIELDQVLVDNPTGWPEPDWLAALSRP